MICQINGALTFFVYYFNWFFLRLIITCRLWVIYVREDNYSNVQVMIKWLIWTIWTPMSSVLKKADKLNLSLSLSLSGQRQAIIRTQAGIMLIGPLGRNFNEILIKIHTLSFKNMHLKMLSGKWRSFCLGLKVLTYCGLVKPYGNKDLGQHWFR